MGCCSSKGQQAYDPYDKFGGADNAGLMFPRSPQDLGQNLSMSDNKSLGHQLSGHSSFAQSAVSSMCPSQVPTPRNSTASLPPGVVIPPLNLNAIHGHCSP
uniref:Uncharacterized protein n=1 Tax=Eutreptiella gymnastica TaxID=73025 RepID=A0A7S1HSL0_9EUGL|mmetsp:Transcript_101128/g.174688  ORF Transcript_101128/g.174688 Transcript_101128/m.174688 type:complete len:101 (+) Transcript_101128:60-362(+)